MRDLAYVRAYSLAEAVSLLNQPGYRSLPLAGGTDLMIQIRNGKFPYDRLIDVMHVPELKLIQIQHEPGGTILLGAGVTVAEMLENVALVSRVPLLMQAGEQFGGPQIRNLATIGGNVINQAACADILPALVCLEAVAYVASPQGEYSLPVSELISHPFPNGRIVRAFSIPVPPVSCKSIYVRLARRQALVIPRLSLAALGRQRPDGIIEEARLVPGAAFSRVRRVAEVEAMLIGQIPSVALFEAAGKMMVDLFMAESGNRWSAPYKKVTLSTLTERALRVIYGD